MSFRILGLLLAGGALGVIARYYAGGLFNKPNFPYGTTLVNVAGSFLIGLFMFAGFTKGYFGSDARIFFVVGFLGCFTTMSSFAYESVALMDDGQFLRASIYFLVNPIACIAGAYLARILSTLVPAHGA